MIGGVLGMGRKMAESRMLDQCRVTRPGPKVWDEDAGQHVQVPALIYSGACRVKHPTTAAKPTEQGSQLLVESSIEVHIPIDSCPLMPGDTITVVGSETRPTQTARAFRVTAPFDGSQTTALRYRVVAADVR